MPMTPGMSTFNGVRLRAAAALVLLATLAGCRDLVVQPAGPDAAGLSLAVAAGAADDPEASLATDHTVFARVDGVRIRIIRDETTPAVDETRTLSDGPTDPIRVEVVLEGEQEALLLGLVLLAAGEPVFDALRAVTLEAGATTQAEGEARVVAGYRNMADTAMVQVQVTRTGIQTIRLDELEPQPANGLSFGGVVFAFLIDGEPSQDAIFGGTGPGDGQYVDDPVLEGNADGVLTLYFETPTPILDFGVAVDAREPLDPGFIVTLLDAQGDTIDAVPVPMDIPLQYAEALFTYDGAPVRGVLIAFNRQTAAQFTRFALDNLTYDAGDATASTGPRGSARAETRAAQRPSEATAPGQGWSPGPGWL